MQLTWVYVRSSILQRKFRTTLRFGIKTMNVYLPATAAKEPVVKAKR
jgi:hypothetical protein